MLLSPAASVAAPAAADSFRNPLLPSGPDPWVIQKDGYYYYMSTLGNRLAIRKVRNMADLARSQAVTIWTPPATGPNSASIWAPELHWIGNRWYVYYSASDKARDKAGNRHIFVLENPSADPTKGQWTDRGMVNTANPGIDATVFQVGGKWYFAYSPFIWPDSLLAIAAMKNPWTLSGETIIARPDQPWERVAGAQIVEAPQFLSGPKGDLFLIYSGGTCKSDDYGLGMLRAKPGSNPLDPKAWQKTKRPVFTKNIRAGVYAPGHAAFFTAPDGQNWIIYHANPGPNMQCTQKRSPRIQPFTFDATGVPSFGPAVGAPQALARPS
ncbi:glycoside hydrolase family 43 protein [Sphingobium sp. AP49]|uniref:glycoside hydrolase family 43 protein n=1 Tax=Sphingobium sp. AP49 TaxID=1144307 RepID=UPI001EE65041|nr:glycoside hydrolase family 43 protein [Sphingobium sp. AP49]WHO39806.1 glycoside hydrolase family 43 protein [Sphingobium sp. AP49]